MESFQEILAVGGHANSLGRANEVLETVRREPSKMNELFECIDADDAWVRMRAIDTFEKLVREDPHFAMPYTDELVNRLTMSDQASIQWHLAQLFVEIELSSSQRLAAIAWLKQRIATTEVDWIVSVNVMKALLYFYDKHAATSDELRPLFEKQTHHASQSVRKKAEKFLAVL